MAFSCLYIRIYYGIYFSQLDTTHRLRHREATKRCRSPRARANTRSERFGESWNLDVAARP